MKVEMVLVRREVSGQIWFEAVPLEKLHDFERKTRSDMEQTRRDPRLPRQQMDLATNRLLVRREDRPSKTNHRRP